MVGHEVSEREDVALPRVHPVASTGAMVLNKPIVGMASTPDGKGYWLVASDGGIFSFGDATFYGSEGSAPLNSPVIGILSPLTGGGYWMYSRQGDVFPL